MIDKKYIKQLLKQSVICNDCDHLMNVVEVPPLHVGDGLGWGCEAFYLCLNNECPTFIKSFKHIKKQFNKLGGYRVMLLPNEKSQTVCMVMSKEAFTGSIIKDVIEDVPQDVIDRLKYGV